MMLDWENGVVALTQPFENESEKKKAPSPF